MARDEMEAALLRDALESDLLAICRGMQLLNVEHSGTLIQHLSSTSEHKCAGRDGVIEGLERPDKRFVVAVQWHPEDRVSEIRGDRELFIAFAEAVRAMARHPADQ